MKDAVHHLKYVQKKVIQSVRKEYEAKGKSPTEAISEVQEGIEQLEPRGKQFRNHRRRQVRMPSRSNVH